MCTNSLANGARVAAEQSKELLADSATFFEKLAMHVQDRGFEQDSALSIAVSCAGCLCSGENHVSSPC